LTPLRWDTTGKMSLKRFNEKIISVVRKFDHDIEGLSGEEIGDRSAEVGRS